MNKGLNEVVRAKETHFTNQMQENEILGGNSAHGVNIINGIVVGTGNGINVANGLSNGAEGKLQLNKFLKYSHTHIQTTQIRQVGRDVISPRNGNSPSFTS